MISSAVDEHGIYTVSGTRAWAGLAGSSAIVSLLGMGLIWATRVYVDSLDVLALSSPDAAILRAGIALKGLAVVMAILGLGTSIYIFRSCGRVREHRQLPPPGTRVLGRPKVLHGTGAVMWAWAGYALAAMLAVIAVVVTVLMWQFVNLMMSGIG